METSLLFEATLDFYFVPQGTLALDPEYHPYSQPVWEGVLLGKTTEDKSQPKPVPGMWSEKQKNSHTVDVSQKFSCPFLLQLHTRRVGGAGFMILYILQMKHWFIHSVSWSHIPISAISLFMTGLCRIQGNKSYSCLQIVHVVGLCSLLFPERQSLGIFY